MSVTTTSKAKYATLSNAASYIVNNINVVTNDLNNKISKDRKYFKRSLWKSGAKRRRK